MQKDNTVYLKNIVDKAEEAMSFCEGKSLQDFLDSNMLQSAVVMKLIVIGEEARKLPPEVTEHIPLPWKLITGFRNMAVHEYFNLDLELVWVTVQEDIPNLIKKCKSYLGTVMPTSE